MTPSEAGSLARARVLLADDNALLAEQIRDLLAARFEVVGVVSSGEELETAFESLAPVVIVTDVAMPGKGGLTAARAILARRPATPIVILSVIDEWAVIRASLSAGVRGYVVKTDAPDELVPAVEAVLQGEWYVSTSGRRELPR